MIQNANMGLITAPAFAGVERLPRELTINGITESPLFWYRGKDASVSGWTADVGTDLSVTGAGITYDHDAIALDEKSVHFSGGTGRIGTSTTTVYDVTTEDIVLEIVPRTGQGAGAWFAKLTADPIGYQVGSFGASARVYLDDGPDSAQVLSGSLVDAYLHLMCFLDRSGFGQWYMNGVASGAAVDISSIGTLTNSAGFAFASNNYGASLSPLTGYILHAAAWVRSAWLDTHLQATVAKERSAIVFGQLAAHSHGALVPDTL